MFLVEDFFDLENEELALVFEGATYVWDALRNCAEVARKLTENAVILGTVHPTAVLEGSVYVGEGSVIGPHVYIKGPTYIGRHTEVRQGAFLRENSIIGDNCVVGHATETKSSIMLKGSHAPHFAYVGDSILGQAVNLGAGTKLSNFKLQGNEIIIYHNGEVYPTGLRKMGAIIGDRSLTGCNTVTAPGTLIGSDSWIYSQISLRGYIPPRSIVKPEMGFRIEQKR